MSDNFGMLQLKKNNKNGGSQSTLPTTGNKNGKKNAGGNLDEISQYSSINAKADVTPSSQHERKQ